MTGKRMLMGRLLICQFMHSPGVLFKKVFVNNELRNLFQEM